MKPTIGIRDLSVFAAVTLLLLSPIGVSADTPSYGTVIAAISNTSATNSALQSVLTLDAGSISLFNIAVPPNPVHPTDPCLPSLAPLTCSLNALNAAALDNATSILTLRSTLNTLTVQTRQCSIDDLTCITVNVPGSSYLSSFNLTLSSVASATVSAISLTIYYHPGDPCLPVLTRTSCLNGP